MNISTSLSPRLAAGLTLLGACALSASASAQVADLCVNAPLYTYNDVVPFDTNNCIDTGAPATDSFSTGPCGGLYNEIWVRYTPHHTGPIAVSTCNNASFDTRINLSVGNNGCSGSLTQWACNDDGSAACNGGTSELTFIATVGSTYYVQVAGPNSTTWGTGTLFFSALTSPPLPDTCAAPNSLTGLSSDSVDTTSATSPGFNGSGSCANVGSNTVNQDAFWVWTAQEDGDYTFDTIGSNFDTKMSLHVGTDCLASCADYNDDISGSNLQSSLTLMGVVVGDQYLVQVEGFGAGAGQAVINVVKDPARASMTA